MTHAAISSQAKRFLIKIYERNQWAGHAVSLCLAAIFLVLTFSTPDKPALLSASYIFAYMAILAVQVCLLILIVSSARCAFHFAAYGGPPSDWESHRV